MDPPLTTCVTVGQAASLSLCYLETRAIAIAKGGRRVSGSRPEKHLAQCFAHSRCSVNPPFRDGSWLTQGRLGRRGHWAWTREVGLPSLGCLPQTPPPPPLRNCSRCWPPHHPFSSPGMLPVKSFCTGYSLCLTCSSLMWRPGHNVGA